MESTETAIVKKDNTNTKILVIGGVIGAVAGVAAAYLLIQRIQKEGGQPHFTAGEGVKLGLLVLGLLRQVSSLAEGK